MTEYSAFGGAKRKSSARKSPKKSARKSGGKKRAVGSRSSVARGGSSKTPGGLSLGNGLFRAKDGRIKSSKVSKLAKSRFAKNPKMKERAKVVKEAFSAVKKARKVNQKINSAAIMKNPGDAARNPSRYLK